MMSERVYGQYDLIPDELVPEAYLEVTVQPIDLTTHWKRTSLLADMMAGYVASAFRGGHRFRESPVYNAVSTVMQELVENAAKFSRQRDAQARLRLRHFDRVLQIQVQNDVTPATAAVFETHVKGLLAAKDLDGVYVKTMEGRRLGDQQSGIGLLLMIKDYPVKLAVRLAPKSPECTVVTVRAHYFLEEA
jgi:hypothetical protein